MTEGISLRKATKEDLLTVLEIESGIQAAPWDGSHFQAELEKPYSHFLVLTDDETDSKILGYLIFWILDDRCEVLNLGVPLEQRGLGFAQLMLKKMIDLAVRAGTKKAVLEVRKSNLPAILLYQKIGFGIAQIRKGFYSSGPLPSGPLPSGEDAYHMVLDFKTLDILKKI